jgi:competence protein ComEA
VEIDRDRLRTFGWIAAAVVMALLAVRAFSGGDGGTAAVTVEPDAPPGQAPGGPSRGAASPAPGADPSSGAAAPLFVHVAGEVRRPGVYRVPRGARVHEAVQLAGGLTRRAEQAGVNLVARVTDGQQVIVPRRGAAPASGGSVGPGGAGSGASGSGGRSAPGGPTGKVSLATATVEQLDAIDGIGPTLARRIVEYRDQHGGFRSVDELRQVDGIGEKRFESLREAVTP